jgi:hypothetical protein
LEWLSNCTTLGSPTRRQIVARLAAIVVGRSDVDDLAAGGVRAGVDQVEGVEADPAIEMARPDQVGLVVLARPARGRVRVGAPLWTGTRVRGPDGGSRPASARIRLIVQTSGTGSTPSS